MVVVLGTGGETVSKVMATKDVKVVEPTPSSITEEKVQGDEMREDGRLYEYCSAANPTMPPIEMVVLPASEHESGPTREIPFDNSKAIGTPYTATSPNLLASYLRIKEGESLDTSSRATSMAFYVIRGAGKSESEEYGTISWSEGDLFVLPYCTGKITHTSSADTAIYHITDEPLLRYLGVTATEKKFEPTVFRKDDMLDKIEEIRHEEGVEHKNRLGVLLGNKVTEGSTKTLTHTLWSLLNTIGKNTTQPPHRHNSVALDLCVSAKPGVYTLMGPELDENGWVKNPIRADWQSGAAFVTPPGWWHSHHNESGEAAWVLPLQDAGLYTYQQTLDINFSTPTTDYKGEPAADRKSVV